MADSVDDHHFNDDLLLSESDQDLAESKYPSIFHVLDHEELRELFSEYDAPANRAKRIGLRAGVCAIGFGFSALAIAALEIPLTHPGCEQVASNDLAKLGDFLAVISGLCGLASFLIGSAGVLFARRKRDWLYHRMMGEHIRLFHFQMLVFRLPQILASLKNDEAESLFILDRKRWFESFKARLVGKLDSAFTELIDEEGEFDPWLHDGARTKEASKITPSKDLDPIFDAYRELRIRHQIGYANYKLQDDHRFISAMPRRQLAVLAQFTFAWIILLCVMHAGILVRAVFPGSVWAAFHLPGVTVAIIWLALAALATRAIEQGLQPEREIERYQQYRSGLRAILERYDEAPSQAAKIEIMREMERLAFDEMRNFLITNERSRFVM